MIFVTGSPGDNACLKKIVQEAENIFKEE